MAEQPIDREESKKNFVELAQKCLPDEFRQFIKEYPIQKRDLETTIKWYTNDSFFFKLLNAIIRGSDDPFTLFYVQLAFNDVFESVRELYEQQELVKEKEELHLYRSTYLN